MAQGDTLCPTLFGAPRDPLLETQALAVALYVLGVSGVVTALLMGLLWTYYGEIPGWLR